MTSLPSLPVKHNDFVKYVNSNSEKPMVDLVQPYNKYEAVLRKRFAQDPSHPSIQDNHVNIVPLYDQNGSTDLSIRARDLVSETPEKTEKYLLPLNAKDRKPHGSAAVVPSLNEFKNNFTLFTEGSLSEIDWSNVVAAGSAVVTSLLPVPEKYRNSKRGLRKYYHEEFAPASDVDLFLYGLTEEQALEKIMHIEDKIKNTILYETTTIRTKNTITIASQYPNRHVQIVLRIYRSVAEILTGFDVDAACAAYDGRQVYASPRAIAAYITQVNQIDLTRRSPSYENRLSKYSHRGFEVFWPALDRSKIDPRSFTRTEGLARLLVLEKLPRSEDRDNYLQKRREERGRPPLNLYLLRRHGQMLHGNLKDDWEDEIPDWQEQDQVSDYHTFNIPYGRRFNAKNIEKLLYTKDLLLNAQWNQPEDRTVYLHRHPAFFGEAEHVIGDCCGFCPKPVTEEEIEVADEEAKIYISGQITFIKDDPGRQEIGSFNPITETDWTEMAYVGRTERLCQAIVAKDVDSVKAFLAEEGANPDRRDYTGRTPLQLACMCSTPEVVQCLVDGGARMIPRMADGKTALHLAAARGHAEIIRILLTKSNENEEEEAKKEEVLKKNGKSEPSTAEDEDVDMIDHNDAVSHTSASYVKVEAEEENEEEDLTTYDTLEEDNLEPDIYDINVVAWDSRTAPLHLAILHGHTEAVKELVTSFGADVLMPVKILNEHNRTPLAAILNLVLIHALPFEKAKEMSQTLLDLGASPAQADLKQKSPLYYLAHSDKFDILDIYMQHDEPAVKRAINHMAVLGTSWTPEYSSALMIALAAKNAPAASKLLGAGAHPEINISEIVKLITTSRGSNNFYDVEDTARTSMKQPIFLAIENDLPLVAIDLLHRGANPNAVIKGKYESKGRTLLDVMRQTLQTLREFLVERKYQSYYHSVATPLDPSDETYLSEFQSGSYKMFTAKDLLRHVRKLNRQTKEHAEKVQKTIPDDPPGLVEKKAFIAELVRDYEKLEFIMLQKDAKTWDELHPPQNVPVPFPAHVSTNKPTQLPRMPWKVSFSFDVPAITDLARDGYLQLFEAAWNGDIDTIKTLTLGMWGSLNDQAPLEIAVTDKQGLSALSISIMRGHFAVAKAIIKILHVQYKVKEPRGRKRFEIDVDGCSDDSDDSDEENDELKIVSDIVDDTFTHENIGEVSSQVESNTSPLAAFERRFNAYLFLEEYEQEGWDKKNNLCNVDGLLKYAVYTNNISLLEFLLKTGLNLASTNPSGEREFLIKFDEFQLAISLGRTDCLSKMIQSAGAGLPLTKLSEDCGVEEKKEPQYYPGLSIRGTKRADWANAGRDRPMRAQTQRPPLLIAARRGNLASTEFFLGTAPARYYLEYLNANKDDERVKRLTQSKLGLEGSLLTWLQARNNLVLHSAILSEPNDESVRLVQYLVDHHPECMEVRSTEGLTPLALAMSHHKVRFARILVDAGANQAVRDKEARNLLHLILVSDSGRICKQSNRCTRLLDLLDKQLLPTMLTERAGKGSRTPFSRWLHAQPHFTPEDPAIPRPPNTPQTDDEMITCMTNLILDLADSTDQKHLEVFDEAGNTPVHDAVKKGFPQVLGLLLDRRPEMLNRENATGTTPLEMAVDAWVNKSTSAPPVSPPGSTSTHPEWQNAIQRAPRFFIPGSRLKYDQEKEMLRVCQERAQQRPGKRRLVSLFEANEVAKRLAAAGRATGRRRFGSGDDHESTDSEDDPEGWGNMSGHW
ncbi:unnamed protein product [Penicillium nalgiovense]|uniref:Ankyrin repeat protein n=1 Tax=Penicillium nalgiovense TaxID=60175 RepID=A0A9W4MLH5_PENNA|nr:unnamed protein product [Penicillium nalgiovense]CAG7976683.1 unnamed protein product [Penicillium nalgiovense]CAG7979074.1 unnamed protein product [Penicillium nalgiovense]CAG7993034.1 unnamed protein product [Penicillium nalgiovense]CAG7996531.1 unnamed protein product [Penicillium nalgiovense]